jgi:hypothetical protein
MSANNLAHPPSNSISNNSGTNAFRSDESGPQTLSILCRQDADDEQFSTLGAAFLSDALEFRGEC